MKIALLPGDGIGPEVMAEAKKVLNTLDGPKCRFDFSEGLIGGAAISITGDPLPAETLTLVKDADAILFGAVGDPRYDNAEKRPEQAILGLRKKLKLYVNLRPSVLFPTLINSSPLKEEIVSGLDMLIVRELTGDVYFGQPKGRRIATDGLFPGTEEGFDTMRYSKPEVERIAHFAFQAARKRRCKVCSVDKANVLETSRLWRQTILDVATQYPDIQLSHLYIDNAVMQLMRAPTDYDVIVTGNLFGDILSDQASMLTGSLGLLATASLGEERSTFVGANGERATRGLYEPAHGSAPDIAGQNKANPLAMILSAAMMLRYSFDRTDLALRIENAVRNVLSHPDQYRTADLYRNNKQTCVSTSQMGDLISAQLLKDVH